MKKTATIHFFLTIFCFLIIFSSLPISVRAENPFLTTPRQFEPVVLLGESIQLSGDDGTLKDVPVTEIYLYAYDASTEQWHLMPYQVDERVHLNDFFNPDVVRHFYFESDTNSTFDKDDELVFMVRDLGDPAPKRAWIDNEESKKYPRVEIGIYDEKEPDKKAYGYLFRSATITTPVPKPYGFAPYDSVEHVVSNNFYTIRLDSLSGLISDVRIKPPFGTGVDIFDTQKLRIAGLLDFGGLFGPLAIGRDGVPMADERNIGVIPKGEDAYYLKYTKNPVVRMMREVRETLVFGQLYLDFLSFYVVTKFYPYNGTLKGGAALDPDSLKQLFGSEEDFIFEFDLLRQSWDFNSNADGMKFYNKNNQNIAIDGVSDNATINKRIDIPIQEWSLITGAQGTMFNHLQFDSTNWGSVELYWFDNKAGGNGDGTVLIDGQDSGDKMSFGDNGILFRNLDQKSVSLELGFTGYFLEGNKDQAFGFALAEMVENPVKMASVLTDVAEPVESTQPEVFRLNQNYPNPFNGSTRITFNLPERLHATLSIIDINGREVTRLVEQKLNAGTHVITWNGRDRRQQPVASGVYFFRLSAGSNVEVKKLILVQ